MAKNNFTFQAALKLNSAGFKKGVNEVKSALAGLKSSFLSLAGALGAGLGFTQFISSMKDTAVQLSTAQNVLKNVSKVTKEYTDGVNKGTIELSNYGENLEYVRRLAKDYSQDLIGLTENFAKFHAACEKTNLDLENQKDVFEALTRAAAYYHMSADQTNDMTLAVTQMMSKGKVSAEELRRQLGNALPGAFNLMAAAIGVSTAELEDMMKKGQVISAEVLPRFAAMLNTVTKGADFDSLQMSLNNLKNSWTEFVEASGAENIFNNIIKGAGNALSFITRNIMEIGALIKGLVTGILAYKLFDILTARGQKYLQEQIKIADQIEKTFKKANEEVIKRFVSTKEATSTTPKANIYTVDFNKLSKEDLDILIKYNDALIRKTKLEQRAGTHGPVTHNYKAELAILEAMDKKLRKLNGEAVGGWEKTKVSFTNFSKTAGAGLKSLFNSVKSGIASLGIAGIISAVLAGLTAIYSYFKKFRDEQKRINGLAKEYVNSVNEASKSVAESNNLLQSHLRILENDADTSEKNLRARKRALSEINKMMGTKFNTDALDKTKKAYRDIVEEVGRWTKATELQAKVQVIASKQAEAQIAIDKINIRNQGLAERREGLSKGLFGGFRLADIERQEKLNKQEIRELTKIIFLADKELDALNVKLAEFYEGGESGPGPGGDKKVTDIQKTYENYTKELKELENQLKEQAITQEEFNDEFDKLVSKFWKEAAGTGKYSLEAIIKKMDKGEALSKMEEWYKNLYEAAQKAAFNNTAKAAAEAIDKAIEDAMDEADKAMDAALDKWADRASNAAAGDINGILANRPTKGKRDSTFDYNKDKSAIFGEDLDVAKDYAKDLEDAIDAIESKYDNLADASEAVKKKLAEWRGELTLAKKEASTLEEVMKITKIQEDIDNLNKAINSAAYGGIKNLASSLDRAVKGAESLREVMENADSTGWEKFMAVFNEFTQIIDIILGAYETLRTVMQATNKLNLAENALLAERVSLLEQELLLRQAINASKADETTKTKALAVADTAAAAASAVAGSKKAGEAVAGATASGAKLPFPYNLAAIAAGLAAVIGALSMMKKFASGGIVGGSSYSGDKQMARVNSGEMILNRSQQRTLWDIVNGRKGTGSGEVQFKIRGADLVGTLKNYNRKVMG